MAKKVLFVNSIQKQCGVQSYGLRTFNILKQSKQYEFIYIETESNEGYTDAIFKHQPVGAIVNYHPSTIPGFSGSRLFDIKELYLWHEGSIPGNLSPDCWLWVDSTRAEDANSFSIPRPLGVLQNMVRYRYPATPVVITSFGFGFGGKCFGSVVKLVNDQFDEAIIRLQIPRAFYGDRNGEATAGVVPGCKNEMYKPGVTLQISHEFMTDQDLLVFLAQSHLNIFLYEETTGRGLSSVIDYSLSVDVPIAISDSEMFRHIQKPEINVANKSLQEIIDQGTAPLQEFKDLWSNDNFLAKYEHILNTTL